MNKQNSKFCVHCGRQLPTTAVFCPGCGEKIAFEEVVPSPASVESASEDKQSLGSENILPAKQPSEAVIIHSSLAMKFLVRLLWIDVGLAIACL